MFLRLWTAALLTSFAPLPAIAHEDPGAQIVTVTREIELHPGDPGLYLRRSDLHRSRREWPEAIADLQAASRLDPGLAVVDLLTARTLLDAGNPEAALAAVDRFLVREGNHAGAHLVRARILLRLGSRAEAAAGFSRGIDLALASGHTAQPDDYLDRAHALVSLGAQHVDEAIRGLDEGTAALGGPIALKLLAIDLEIARRHWDAALERLSAIEAKATRKEHWIVRRADVLQDAGRRCEAVQAYRLSLATIQALPERLRSSQAAAELAGKVRTRLADADSSPGSLCSGADAGTQVAGPIHRIHPSMPGPSPDEGTP